MSGYVKLYSTLITSSVWAESQSTRIVWITMLTMADKNGDVLSSHSGLSRIANVSRAELEDAIKVLLAPDPDSRTEEHEGRRIEKIEGGWFIINHAKYREMRTESQVEWAEKKRLWREQNEAQKVSGDMSEDKTDSPKMSEDKTIASSSSSSSTTTSKETTTTLVPYPADFEVAWKAFPGKAGGNPKGEAYAQYKARVKEGAATESLLSGVHRYAAYIRATGDEGTRFVQMGKTFFGKGRHWEEPWTLPITPKKLTEHDRNAAVLDAYLARKEAANG